MEVTYDVNDIKRLVEQHLKEKNMNLIRFEFIRYGDRAPVFVATTEDTHE